MTANQVVSILESIEKSPGLNEIASQGESAAIIFRLHIRKAKAAAFQLDIGRVSADVLQLAIAEAAALAVGALERFAPDLARAAAAAE